MKGARFWREPVHYIPAAVFVYAVCKGLPLGLLLGLSALLLVQAGGLYLAHREYVRRNREMDEVYRRTLGKDPPAWP